MNYLLLQSVTFHWRPRSGLNGSNESYKEYYSKIKNYDRFSIEDYTWR